jgi:hypothetical protein
VRGDQARLHSSHRARIIGRQDQSYALHPYDADAAEPHVDPGRTLLRFGLSIDGWDTAGPDLPLGVPGD